MPRGAHRSAAAILLTAAAAGAQPCQPSWNSRFTVGGTAAHASHQLIFDDDGPGPHAPALYFIGNWNTVYRWDGAAFTPLPALPSIEGPLYIYDLVIDDPDGPGPALPTLVVSSYEAFGQTATNGSIFRWDGAAWTRIVGPLQGYTFGPLASSGGSSLPRGLYGAKSHLLPNGDLPTTIAYFDGQALIDIPGPAMDRLYKLAILDEDGPGPHGPSLLIGGARGTLVRWDGASWSGLGSGILPQPGFPIDYASVSAFAVFDPDGPGPDRGYLYVGGEFYSAGGIASPNLARWDGTGWAAVGAGGDVNSFVQREEGGSPVLYAGGRFTSVAGVPATYLARFSGGRWLAVAPGLTTDCYVDSLAFFDDDGDGPKLPYLSIAGTLPWWVPSVAGLPARNLARWDGQHWVPWPEALSGPVHAAAVFDDGRGPALYAAGEFLIAGGGYVNCIARWSGAAWEPLAGGLDDHVYALAAFDDGSGPALYAGGQFTHADNGAGPIPAPYLARWRGGAWSTVGADAPVMALLPTGSGPAATLYVGGQFTHIGGIPASRIASLTSAGWSALSLETDNILTSLCIHNDGGGPRLIAGGAFQHIGGIAAGRIASYDGSAWSPLGAGVNNQVHTLCSFRQDGAPALFVGGRFTQAGGTSAIGIAVWSQGAWSPVGPGMSNHVDALAVFDDGSGPALYAGGKFTHVAFGTEPLNCLARWDGLTWRPVSGGADSYVETLAALAPGGGRASLYLGGLFTRFSQTVSPFLGQLDARTPACYPNCDGSTTAPILNISDFVCFNNRFAAGDAYANCDGSTVPPILNVSDFICFLNRYTQGCP